MALQDSAGKIKAISNRAPSVMVTGHGEGWSSPLSQFTSAGVNLSNVRRMIIGIGDRNAPKAGGKGKLNVDDIRLTRMAP